MTMTMTNNNNMVSIGMNKNQSAVNEHTLRIGRWPSHHVGKLLVLDLGEGKEDVGETAVVDIAQMREKMSLVANALLLALRTLGHEPPRADHVRRDGPLFHLETGRERRFFKRPLEK